MAIDRSIKNCYLKEKAGVQRNLSGLKMKAFQNLPFLSIAYTYQRNHNGGEVLKYLGMQRKVLTESLKKVKSSPCAAILMSEK